MWGRASEWQELAEIISRGARDLLAEYRRAQAPARLTVTVQLEIGDDTRVCEVRMGTPPAGKRRDEQPAAPGRSESPPGRPDAANAKDRTWAGLGARHER